MRIIKLSILFFAVFFISSINLYAWTPGLEEAAKAVSSLSGGTPEQEMMVFLNNPEINLMGQEGIITEYTYASCQNEFFELNEKFVKQAVNEAGFDSSISDRKFNPGTDTDVNINAKSKAGITVKDIEKIENDYQRVVKEHFRKKGLNPPEGRINTDTDFMPNPQHTTPEEFKKCITHINNNGGTAYTDPKAASAQAKLSTGQPISIDEASSFNSTMKVGTVYLPLISL